MAAGERLTQEPARRAAVIGRPVGHSRSPALHRAAYEALGLGAWSYDAVDVGPDDLPALFRELDAGWAGLSVTMPLKQAVVPLLAGISDVAAAVGAVNTVVVGVSAGGGVRLTGDNTDVHGIVAALGEAGVDGVEAACVLGAGATAASALAALVRLGCRAPAVHVRSAARADGLRAAARRLGAEPTLVRWGDEASLRAADVVVSTVPADAGDAGAAAIARLGRVGPLDGAGGAGRRRPVLLDAVYDPWPTPVGQAWAAVGGQVVDGLEMLLHQAAGQVEAFTGRPAPVEVMRAAVRR